MTPMPNILMSMVLAVGRVMGETMAVMMVMGNANLFPKLLGKAGVRRDERVFKGMSFIRSVQLFVWMETRWPV